MVLKRNALAPSTSVPVDCKGCPSKSIHLAGSQLTHLAGADNLGLGDRTMKITIRTTLAAALLLVSSTFSFAQRDMDCSDFRSWREAQDFYERSGPGDPHGLDRDNDGIACESLN
jgi:hypothetical protein